MRLNKILIATDFSEQADVAFAHAQAIAERTSAELVVLWVEGEGSRGPGSASIYGTAAPEVERLAYTLRTERISRLNELVERARTHGVAASARVETGYPEEVIVAVGRDVGADLTVTGTKGLTGINRFFLGSVAAGVVRASDTNVLVARGTPKPLRRILVPTDFSPTAEKAVTLAVALADSGAEIDLLYAWQYPAGTHGLSTPDPKDGPLAALRDQIVQTSAMHGMELVARYSTPERTVRFVQAFGPAAALIQERLESHAYDLVAMGTHGYRGFRRFLLGSVAEATVQHAPCSVLVAHAGDVGA